MPPLPKYFFGVVVLLLFQLLPTDLRGQDSYDSLVRDAASAASGGNAASAAALYEKALSLASTPSGRSDVRIALAKVNITQGKYEQARKILEENLSDAPAVPKWETVDSLKLMADSYVKETKFDEAQECLARGQSLPFEENGLKAHLLLHSAEISKIVGDKEAAIATYDRILQMPNVAKDTLFWPNLWKGALLKSRGDTDQAIALFQKAFEIAVSIKSQSAIKLAQNELKSLGVTPDEKALEVRTPLGMFFAPETGHLADIVPFYWKGNYHIFYLHGIPGKKGVSWSHAETADFNSIKDFGEAIPTSNSPEVQDLNIFTGSIIHDGRQFLAFYTGHNGSFVAQKRRDQILMMATSPDLMTWTKRPDFQIPSDTAAGYAELGGWRDPDVLKVGDEYWMVLCASRRNPPRDCVGWGVSSDLKNWEFKNPIFEDTMSGKECPNLFKFGDWWYLIISSYKLPKDSGGGWVTRYLMSRTPEGPWTVPSDIFFDGGGYYAAKTAGDDKTRFLCGWLASRKSPKGDTPRDNMPWDWGGNLLAYQLKQRPDGTLAAMFPPAVEASFTTRCSVKPEELRGKAKLDPDSIVFSAPDSVVSMGTLPPRFYLSLKIDTSSSGGILLGGDNKLEHGFRIVVDAEKKELRLEGFPKPLGDPSQPDRLVRPLREIPKGGSLLEVVVDGDALAICIDKDKVLSGRMYDRRSDNWGFFGNTGTRVSNWGVKSRR